MIKEKLKKILTKTFYVIFAIAVSIALWVYVEITENEIQTQVVPNIRIDYRNEDVLRDRGMLVTRSLTENLTLTFEGPRAYLSRLAAPGALSVEVDLSNIMSTGANQLTYEIIYPPQVNVNAIDIRSRSATRITLEVDRVSDRQIPVVVNYMGGTAADYLIPEAAEFDPPMIRISGPDGVLSMIDHIYVPILRENLSASITEDFDFILVDDNGEELSEELREALEFSHDTVRVTIPVRQIKDLALTVLLSHGVGTSEDNTNWSVTPQFVTVSGDPEVIRDLNQITLGTIDMLSLELSDTRPFPIIIPEHLTNMSGETTAQVHVEVFRLSIGYHSTSNLHTINIPQGFRDDIITQSLDVRIRGREEDLVQVGSMNIRVVADLTDFGAGHNSVPVNIYIDGIDVAIDVVGDYRIFVTLTAED